MTGMFNLKSLLFAVVAWVIVAFGQPAFFSALGVVSSALGFALLFNALIGLEKSKERFWLGALWFSSVQAVQLSWVLSHPFSYAYGLYAFLLFGMGGQFGLLSLFLTKERIASFRGVLALSGLWVLLEWSRLFFLSGFSFNPVGIALSGSLYGMQAASVFGVFGLSFWVIATNAFCLRAKLKGFRFEPLLTAILFLILPYLYGFWHFESKRGAVEQADRLKALLVQTAFPIEENISFQTFDHSVQFTEKEWKEIFALLAPYVDEQVDLIALPEYVVPFGTYIAIFPADRIRKSFVETFGVESSKALPPLELPYALEVEGVWHLSNAYICQALSNLFKADLAAGLQDDQWVSKEEMRSYSSGFYFWPGGKGGFRYEKQVLLPMAEYIPFQFCKKMAAEYGISGSFTCGTGAKVFSGCKVPFGLSICYEETYGHLMRENRALGAELLVNLSSDVWYPNSRLPKQHFDHARLRTVENGIPLLRACNTGITGAINSLGEIVAQTHENQEWDQLALPVEISLYHYRTIYSKWGDGPLIGCALLFLLLGAIRKKT